MSDLNHKKKDIERRAFLGLSQNGIYLYVEKNINPHEESYLHLFAYDFDFSRFCR